MARYRVGTTSWSYDDWVGSFYPPTTPSTEFLKRYSKVFDLVEADATFYRIPTLEVVANWASQTPDGFAFTTKLSRRITHEAGLVDVGEPTRFFLSRMQPLRDAGKLAAVLAQFPPSFTRTKNQANLEKFVAAWPKEARLAVEFRHKSWFEEPIYDALRKHGASLVWQVDHESLSPSVLTADWLYVRLIGPDRVFDTFDRIQRDVRPQLEQLRARLDDEGQAAREVLLLCSNHLQGHGPGSAALLREVLGLPKADLEAAKLPVGAQRGLADFA